MRPLIRLRLRAATENKQNKINRHIIRQTDKRTRERSGMWNE